MTSSDVVSSRSEASVNPTSWSLEELDAVVNEGAGQAPSISFDEQQRVDIEEAFERGRREGHAAGEAKARQVVTTALRALAEATAELSADTTSWRAALSRNLHALAVAIAKQVIQRELRTDADTIEQVVGLAMTEFPMEEIVTVRLNPADLTLLSAHALESQTADVAVGAILPGGREIKWRADAKIERGGCVVEGVQRLVDGRVDTALLRIYQRLGDV